MGPLALAERVPVMPRAAAGTLAACSQPLAEEQTRCLPTVTLSVLAPASSVESLCGSVDMVPSPFSLL